MALGAPGFEPRTHHLTNPGLNDEKPVAVERRQFETWLRMTVGQGVLIAAAGQRQPTGK